MADPITDLTNIGQKALELPQNVLNTEMRQMNEKLGVLTSGVQNMMASAPQLPVLGQGLPQLPALPGIPGVSGAGTPAPQSRSEATQGVKKTKKTSYLEA